MSDHIGPDCRDGKHPACDGRAWDDEADTITDCDCDCHKEENMTDPLFAEVFWAGYLKALAEMGAVTAETPADEVWQMKADFMAGLRGEPMPCETEARTE